MTDAREKTPHTSCWLERRNKYPSKVIVSYFSYPCNAGSIFLKELHFRALWHTFPFSHLECWLWVRTDLNLPQLHLLITKGKFSQSITASLLLLCVGLGQNCFGWWTDREILFLTHQFFIPVNIFSWISEMKMRPIICYCELVFLVYSVGDSPSH